LAAAPADAVFRFVGELPHQALRLRAGRPGFAQGRPRTWLGSPVVLPAVGRPIDLRAQRSLEYEVKAAFLFNFVRFVAWPGESCRAAEPFRICIAGENPFSGALERTVAGEQAAGRPIEVELLPPEAPPARCEALFVPRSQALPHGRDPSGRGDAAGADRRRVAALSRERRLGEFRRRGGLHPVRYQQRGRGGTRPAGQLEAAPCRAHYRHLRAAEAMMRRLRDVPIRRKLTVFGVAISACALLVITFAFLATTYLASGSRCAPSLSTACEC
jgi:hypothetical protein